MRRMPADPGAELREEDCRGHGDGELAALHGFGAFVGGFKLRVHPLVGEEAGAILGDAVAAHEADGLAHHVGAVTGVPKLGGGTEHVGLGILEDELDERIGGELGAARVAGGKGEEFDGARFEFAQGFDLGAASR